MVDVDAATIRLLDPSGLKLVLEAASGLSETYLNRGPIDSESSVLKALEGTPIAIPDATTDIHTLYHKQAASEDVGSILAVPISVKGEPIGMMRLLTTEVRFFSNADINFAMTVADQGGVAIQNAIDYQKMQDLLNECDASKPFPLRRISPTSRRRITAMWD